MKFGKIQEVTVVFDASSNRPGGFGFINFAEEDSLHKVLKINHMFLGVRIDCKIALDKDEAKFKDEQERA